MLGEIKYFMEIVDSLNMNIINKLFGGDFRQYYSTFLSPYKQVFDERFPSSKNITENSICVYIEKYLISDVRQIIKEQRKEIDPGEVNPHYIQWFIDDEDVYKLFMFIMVDFYAIKPKGYGFNKGTREWMPVTVGVILGEFSVVFALLTQNYSVSLLLLCLAVYLVYSFYGLEQSQYYYYADRANPKVIQKMYSEKLVRCQKFSVENKQPYLNIIADKILFNGYLFKEEDLILSVNKKILLQSFIYKDQVPKKFKMRKTYYKRRSKTLQEDTEVKYKLLGYKELYDKVKRKLYIDDSASFFYNLVNYYIEKEYIGVIDGKLFITFMGINELNQTYSRSKSS